MSVDPIIALYEQVTAVKAAIRRKGHDDGAIQDAVDRLDAIEGVAIATRPTTLAGAIVALRWAVDETREVHQLDGVEGAGEGVIILALLEGALGVLRTLAAVGCERQEAGR